MPDFKKFNQDFFTEEVIEETRVQRLKMKKNRKKSFFKRLMLFIIIIGALAYAAFVYGDGIWITLADKYFSGRIAAAGSAAIPQKEEFKNHLNIMLVGTDQRENEPSRSDTIMVAMLNLKQKSVQVISIPRDTRVEIEGLKNRTKINHAHSNGGIELTRKTVENLLGIPIHNYVETNFEGFTNIIDIIGGVEFDVEKRMYYPAENINLKKGLQRLDGEDALAYVRYRSDGKGDLPRIERQHKFLKAVAAEVLQPQNVVKLPKMVREFYKNVNTDMSVSDLLVLAGEFKNINPDQVDFRDIPGEPDYINGASYYVVDEDKLKLLMDAVLSGRDPDAALQEDQQENAPGRDKTE